MHAPHASFVSDIGFIQLLPHVGLENMLHDYTSVKSWNISENPLKLHSTVTFLSEKLQAQQRKKHQGHVCREGYILNGLLYIVWRTALLGVYWVYIGCIIVYCMRDWQAWGSTFGLRISFMKLSGLSLNPTTGFMPFLFKNTPYMEYMEKKKHIYMGVTTHIWEDKDKN